MVDDDELELVRVVVLVELVGQPELVPAVDGLEIVEADPFGPLEAAADRGAVRLGVEHVFVHRRRNRPGGRSPGARGD